MSLLPREIWGMILNINYQRFCIRVARVLPLNLDESWKDPFIKESVIGNISLQKITEEIIGFACHYQPSIVELLIDNGSNVNYRARVTKTTDIVAGRRRNWIPLTHFVTFHPSLFRLLIDNGADINAPGSDGMIIMQS